MDLTGRKAGKYDIIERLGQGGMAEVYRAFQPGVERDVALKVMHGHLANSADFIARFRREAQAIGRLHHANIVRIIDFDVEADLYYMVMDYIPSGTLDAYLKERQQPLAVEEAVELTLQLADALTYAHDQGMIHRDIKPANIMFRDPAHTQPVLTDFGIARLMDEGANKLTLTGSLVGTPTYMSPEAAQGEPCDGRADIYSLGVVFYQMVAGRPPYMAETPYSLMMKQATEPIPPIQDFNPKAPKAVQEILSRALARDVADRFQSAAEMADALTDLRESLGGASSGPRRAAISRSKTNPQSQKSGVSPIGRRRMLLAGAGILVLLIAVITTFALLSVNPQPQGGAPEAETEPLTSAAATSTSPAQDQGEAGAAAPLVATEPAPTQVDTPEEAASPAKPTAVPPTPLPPTPLPTATPSRIEQPRSLGALRLLPDDKGMLDRFHLELEPVRQPPAGFHYALWLTGPASASLYLGALPLEDGRVDFAGTVESDLLATFDQALMGLEVDGGAGESLPETVVYSSTLSAPSLPPLHAMLSAQEDGMTLLSAAVRQAEIAALHGDFLRRSLAADDWTAARSHAEHVINILEGETGPRYGDLDKNGAVENPAGDAQGVRPRLEAVAANLALLPAGSVPALVYADVMALTTDALTTSLLAQETAMQIIAADTPQEALPRAEALTILLDQLLRGRDLDQDGVVDLAHQEGGLLYMAALAPGLVGYHFTDPGALVMAAADQERSNLTPVGWLRLAANPTPIPATATPANSGGSGSSSGMTGGGNSGGYTDNYGGGYGSSAPSSATATPEPAWANRFRLNMERVQAPPPGAHYQLWLLNSQDGATLNLGQVDVEMGQISLAGAVEQELLVGFDQIQLRLTAETDSAPAAQERDGEVVYQGVRSPDLAAALNTLLVQRVDDKSTPLQGAIAQLALANLHTGFLQNELDKENLAEAQRHAEHVLNILSGKNGQFFGDPDGDGMPQNPGDGVGASSYLYTVQGEIQTLLDTEQLTGEEGWAAAAIVQIAARSLSQIERSEETALRIFAADTPAEVQGYEDSIRELLFIALHGQDLDGSGVVDPWAGEGGVAALPDFVIRLGAYQLVSLLQ